MEAPRWMIPSTASNEAGKLGEDQGNVASHGLRSGSELVCAAIVTYRPDMDALRDNLSQVLQQVGGVVIFDNDSEAGSQAAVKALVDSVAASRPGATIALLSEGTNIGLARAYNRSMRKARELGAEFILLLDQDSLLEPKAVERLLVTFQGISAARPVGALCCTTLELVPLSRPLNLLKELLRTGIYRREYADLGELGFPGAREIATFTNSGTMLPLRPTEEIGGFDESLFVDAVDHEFSLRLRNRGFKIFLSDAARVRHRQGETYHASFAGKKLELRMYSPERTYLIFRDTLNFSHRWWRRFPRVVGITVLTLLLNTIAALLFLPQRSERGRLAILALSDFGHHKRTLPRTDLPRTV
ncbi:MAG: glycosyltransferase [Thermoplasmata archaeon]|nr:glycosyltransferase [Thermoplasmata archaeon]